jgi:hypothetical protein
MKGDGIPLTPASGALLPRKDLFGGVIDHRVESDDAVPGVASSLISKNLRHGFDGAGILYGIAG